VTASFAIDTQHMLSPVQLPDNYSILEHIMTNPNRCFNNQSSTKLWVSQLHRFLP